MDIRFVILSLLSFFAINVNLLAQEKQGIEYHFSKNTIEISIGETFSNMLVLSNTSGKTVILKEDTSKSKFPVSIIALPNQITIGPGETRAFPIKFTADKHIIVSNEQVFSLTFKAPADSMLNISPEAHFVTKITNQRGLVLSLDNPEIYINEYTNQASIVVRCLNAGVVPVTFTLKVPDSSLDLEFSGNFAPVTVGASETRLITFEVKKKHSTALNSDCMVTVAAISRQGGTLATKLMHIQSIGSNKRFRSYNDDLSGNLTNIAGLRYATFSKDFSIFQTFGKGNIIESNDGAMDLSYIMDYYIKQHSVVLYNTYLNYQTKNWGFKAGNINENLDYPINGRGIAAKTIWDQNKTLSVYAVENQYMLLNTFTNGIPGIKTVAADYYEQHPSFYNWRTTYIRNTYSLNGLVQNQISGKYNRLLGRGSTLGFEAGLSTEAYKVNSQTRGAFALGANYSGDIDKYRFTSNNYFSSPYYTGLRRGLLQTQTQVVRRIDDNNSLSAYISILSSNPKDLYRDTISLFNNFRKNAISIFELGYNKQFGRYGLNLRPYLLLQKLNGESYITGTATSGTWSSGSARLAAALSYNSKRQSFFIQTDYGYNYHNYVGGATGARHSLRINGNFTSAFIGVSTLIQFNPYYLSDILAFGNGAKYRIYSFGPVAHIAPLNKQLDIQASVMYNHYSFNRTDNYSANSNIRWLMRNNWTLTGTLFYNMLDQRSSNYQKDYYGPVQNQRYNNFQLSIGIEKQFGALFNKKTKKLELSYYEDANGNGKKDDEELLAKGVVVALNGQPAITNDEGKVKYTNLKEGDYNMAIKSSNGWSLQNPVNVRVHKNLKLEIPLIKTKVLKGAVVLIKDRFIKENVVLSGIVIEAIGIAGKPVETLTNENGEFYFYLPPGKYTVFVKSKNPAFSILNETEEINLTGGDVKPVIFKYKNESRKVDVKRF
jgi:hypothetical protein